MNERVSLACIVRVEEGLCFAIGRDAADDVEVCAANEGLVVRCGRRDDPDLGEVGVDEFVDARSSLGDGVRPLRFRRPEERQERERSLEPKWLRMMTTMQ